MVIFTAFLDIRRVSMIPIVANPHGQSVTKLTLLVFQVVQRKASKDERLLTRQLRYLHLLRGQGAAERIDRAVFLQDLGDIFADWRGVLVPKIIPPDIIWIVEFVVGPHPKI